MKTAYKNLFFGLVLVGASAGLLMPTQADAVTASFSIDETTLANTVLNGLGTVAANTVKSTAGLFGQAWTNNIADKEKTLLVLGAVGGLTAWWGLNKIIKTTKDTINMAKRSVVPAALVLAAGAGYYANGRPRADQVKALAAVCAMTYVLWPSEADVKIAQAAAKKEIELLEKGRVSAEQERKAIENALPTVS